MSDTDKTSEAAQPPVTDEHCPECGAYGSIRSEPSETVVVCPNDDCPQIIISVRSYAVRA